MKPEPPDDVAISRRLAIIDVGTNSARLLVADIDPRGTWQAIRGERIACRLGAGLAESGAIAPEAEERTTLAIATLLAAAGDAGAVAIRVVATHALRAARNATACRERMERRLGVPLQVLSEEDEAALALRVARRWMPRRPRGDLVALDLGGGSLEIALERHGRIETVSLALGAVVLSGDVPVDVVPPTAIEALSARVGAALQRGASRFANVARDVAAAGGTATSAARLCGLRAPLSGALLQRHDIERVLSMTARCDRQRRAVMPGVGDRADIIVPGLAVLVTTLRFIGATQCFVLEHGVREGALLALAAGDL